MTTTCFGPGFIGLKMGFPMLFNCLIHMHPLCQFGHHTAGGNCRTAAEGLEHLPYFIGVTSFAISPPSPLQPLLYQVPVQSDSIVQGSIP